jgi:hypothetical protein
MEVSFGEHPYPPALLWQYFVDAEKRLRWQPAADQGQEPAQPARTPRGGRLEPLRPWGGRRRATRIPRLAPVQLLHQPLHALGSQCTLLRLYRDIRVHPHRHGNEARLPASTGGPWSVDAAPIPDRPAWRAQGSESVADNAPEDPRRGRRRTLAGRLPRPSERFCAFTEAPALDELHASRRREAGLSLRAGKASIRQPQDEALGLVPSASEPRLDRARGSRAKSEWTIVALASSRRPQRLPRASGHLLA